MAVTAYKFAGTAENANRDSKASWTSPDNAKADDTSYSDCQLKNDYSGWLRLTNFGFSSSDIPSGSTIDGIEIVVGRHGLFADVVSDSAIYLRNSSGQTGNNLASATKWPSSEAAATYGGATDKCGTSLTQSDIVASTFGIDFSAVSTSSNAEVNYIKIRVYYTAGGGSTVFLPNIMKHNFIPPMIGGY